MPQSVLISRRECTLTRPMATQCVSGILLVPSRGWRNTARNYFQTGGGVFGLLEYAANTGYSKANALRRPASYYCFFAAFCAG
jgi:hypothetical protein